MAQHAISSSASIPYTGPAGYGVAGWVGGPGGRVGGGGGAGARILAAAAARSCSLRGVGAGGSFTEPNAAAASRRER
ncbi:MAG: hypothetical protein ACR2PL_15825 [Dehalococcoidia bacterium]